MSVTIEKAPAKAPAATIASLEAKIEALTKEVQEMTSWVKRLMRKGRIG